MPSQPVHASAMFACRNPLLTDSARFDALLDAVATASAPLQLSYRFTVTNSGGVARGKPLRDRKRIWQLWNRSTTSELHLTSLDPDAYIGSSRYAHVTFIRHPVPYRRPGAENFLQSVSLVRSIGASDTGPFLSGAQNIVRLLWVAAPRPLQRYFTVSSARQFGH
jgi:hypothetical protein